MRGFGETKTSGLCRRLLRCRSRRRWRVGSSETNFGNLPRAFFRFEVSVVAREPAHSRHQTVREERNERVVILHSLIVAAALHGDAMLCSRQLVLQSQNIVIRFTLRLDSNNTHKL